MNLIERPRRLLSSFLNSWRRKNEYANEHLIDIGGPFNDQESLCTFIRDSENNGFFPTSPLVIRFEHGCDGPFRVCVLITGLEV